MKGLEVIGATLGKYGFSRHIIAALKFFLRNPYETLIVTNADGRIEFLDRGSEKFFGLAQGEAKDLHIRELFPESSIPATLETRIPIVGRIFEIEDKKGVGSVYPLLENDKILGAVATLTFYSLEEVDRINSELGRLRRKVRYFEEKQRSEHAAIYSFGNILGTSSLMRDTIEIAKRISVLNSDVLIVGESGTGKELFAHSIHDFSLKGQSFVKINCPAIPFELAESELFGYEKGAFSGALSSGRPGKFEAANDGTIFMDEISSLPLSIQAKFLRVLQEREVQRLGSTRTRRINFRLISVTNKDLKSLVREGKFRDDLYYRVAKASIFIPPLREREEDIRLCIDHFTRTICSSFRIPPKTWTNTVLTSFLQYDWPGNVRELINVLEQTILKAWTESTIEQHHVPGYIVSSNELPDSDKPQFVRTFKEEAAANEKAVIESTLTRTNGNKREAARILGMARSVLYNKMHRYDIRVAQSKNES